MSRQKPGADAHSWQHMSALQQRPPQAPCSGTCTCRFLRRPSIPGCRAHVVLWPSRCKQGVASELEATAKAPSCAACGTQRTCQKQARARRAQGSVQQPLSRGCRAATCPAIARCMHVIGCASPLRTPATVSSNQSRRRWYNRCRSTLLAQVPPAAVGSRQRLPEPAGARRKVHPH